MCGRFTGFEEDDDAFAAIYAATRQRFPNALLKSGEIFPTDIVPIIAGDACKSYPAKWGFPSFRGKGVLINARIETAPEKPMFRDSFLSRRVVIPTTGYLEWSKDKVKYRFNTPGTRLLYLAGFGKRFENELRFVILTTAPNESVLPIHDRMPVILDANSVERWIADTDFASGLQKATMPLLIKEAVNE